MSWAVPRGQQDPSRPFGDIAKTLLRRKKFAEKGRYSALDSAWREIAGDGVGAHTRIRAFKEGKLVIEVDSSTLLHELGGFLRDSLLKALQETEAGRDIAQMEFRLGNARRSEGEP